MIEQVVRILESAGIEYCLIGAAAVAARGAPRSTQDIDLFTTEKRTLNDALWQQFGSFEIHKGDFDDALAGVVRIGKKPKQVDVVVGKWKWEDEIVRRAERLDIGGLVIPVPLRPDVILLKLAAGSPLDYQDAIRLLQLGPRAEIVAHVDGIISRLPKEAQKLWQQLLRDTATP